MYVNVPSLRFARVCNVMTTRLDQRLESFHEVPAVLVLSEEDQVEPIRRAARDLELCTYIYCMLYVNICA